MKRIFFLLTFIPTSFLFAPPKVLSKKFTRKFNAPHQSMPYHESMKEEHPQQNLTIIIHPPEQTNQQNNQNAPCQIHHAPISSKKYLSVPTQYREDTQSQEFQSLLKSLNDERTYSILPSKMQRLKAVISSVYYSSFKQYAKKLLCCPIAFIHWRKTN